MAPWWKWGGLGSGAHSAHCPPFTAGQKSLCLAGPQLSWGLLPLNIWWTLCPLPEKQTHIQKVISHNSRAWWTSPSPSVGLRWTAPRPSEPSSLPLLLRPPWSSLTWEHSYLVEARETWPSEQAKSLPLCSAAWFNAGNIYWAHFVCEAVGWMWEYQGGWNTSPIS